MEDKKRKKDDKRKREASQKVSVFAVTYKLLHLCWTFDNKSYTFFDYIVDPLCLALLFLLI